MAEKASIFQGVQIGLEVTPGTAVAANKKLLSMSFNPGAKVEADAFRAMGNKYASFVTLNKEWSEVGIDGKMTYNEILYALSSLLSTPTPVQQGATSAYKWTFGSNNSAVDESQSLTVQQGDATTAWQSAGVRVSGLTFTFNRSECKVSGSAVGQQLDATITMTGNPTSLTPKPILPGHVKFYMADTQAGLAGASALTRGFSMEWALTDKFGLAWPVGQSAVAIETEPKFDAKLKLATDAVGTGLLTTMRSGATKWFRVKATGSLIASTFYNDFQLDFPAQINDVGEFSNEDGLYLVEFGLAGIYDSVWGKPFQIDVITDVQTL